MEQSIRDLALLNLAIDSKLRGCDVVAVRVDDVAPNGHAIERATVRQRKTGRPVRFELTEQTRQAINEYLAATGKKPGDYYLAGGDLDRRCRRADRQRAEVRLPFGLDMSVSGDAFRGKSRQLSERAKPTRLTLAV